MPPLRKVTTRVDRDAGTFSVRPLRRRKVYTLPLGTVATLVCGLVLRAELAAKKAAKKKRRRR